MFWRIGENSNACGEDKIWKASEGDNRKEEVGGSLPTTQDEECTESVFGGKRIGAFETHEGIGDLASQWDRRLRAISDNVGIRAIFQNIGRLANERWETLNW